MDWRKAYSNIHHSLLPSTYLSEDIPYPANDKDLSAAEIIPSAPRGL